jgi:hypothetical protein
MAAASNEVMNTSNNGHSTYRATQEMFEAIEAGNAAGVKAALEKGADAKTFELLFDITDIELISPATPEIVSLLIQYGADINSLHSIGGSTLLTSALRHSVSPRISTKDKKIYKAIAEVLLDAGADTTTDKWYYERVLSVRDRTAIAKLLKQMIPASFQRRQKRMRNEAIHRRGPALSIWTGWNGSESYYAPSYTPNAANDPMNGTAGKTRRGRRARIARKTRKAIKTRKA